MRALRSTRDSRSRTLELRRLPAQLLFLALLSWAGPLWAEDSEAEPSVEEEEPPAPRLEVGVLPLISYDSDLGIGFGVLGNLAKIDPELEPWRWRLTAQVFFSLKPEPPGPPRLPYQSHYLRLDKPGLANGRLRLRVELRFQRQSNTGYYGLGQGSAFETPWDSVDPEEDPEGWEAARRFNEYDRIHPSLESELRLSLPHGFFAFGGAGLTWNWLDVAPGSRLDLDRRGGSGSWVQEQLVGLQRHGTLAGTLGIAWDSRDSEAAPDRGQFHELSLRGGGLLELPGGWGGANLTARFYAPLVAGRLTLASRVLVDLLWGQVPFYELARFGGTEAEEGPGGSMSVRGLPARRYHGRLKAIGNVELRSRIVLFRLAGQASSFGAVVFVDAGRVWADTQARPKLDTGGHPLGLGLGGGLRLQVGETFIVRADVAWSPGTYGIAFDVGHVF